METRANYAMIGAFVLLAALMGLGFALWLGQSQFNQEYDSYDIVFEGPVSLEEGASVRYIGIKVGEVVRIGIDRDDDSKVRARIRVDAETPVKTDSSASIEFAGITGVTFVQINAGSPEAGRLQREPGQDVPVIEAIQSPVSELFSSGTEVMGRATMTLERLDDLLSQDNIDSVTTTLENIEAISSALSGDGTLAADLSEVLASVNDAAQSFDKASQTLDRFGTTADTEIVRIGAEISELLTELEGISTTAREGIESGQRAADAAADLIEGPTSEAVNDVRLIAADFRVLIRRLDRLTRELEQNPQGLLRSDPLPYEGDN
ncbi:MAG: MlaD family protein [Henriciella sp.]|uniref:MlaD family protein n=1 Tax=Henriciella sp. TaxID=1968823 RepID=UPI003C71A8EA